MEYGRFERLVIGITAVLVMLSIAITAISGGWDTGELVGQIAIVAVMATAVHWGRRVGTFAALAACLVYLALQLPLLATGLSTEGFVLMASRFAGYCVIGIVGGELFSRLKYLLSSTSGVNAIDDWSRVYNQHYAASALNEAIERRERYDEPFSAIIVSVTSPTIEGHRPEQLRTEARAIAGVLRDDVRMIDDVARLDDGRFMVLLPHTPGRVAPVVAGRLTDSVCRTLGAKDDCVEARCLDAESDLDAIKRLAGDLRGLQPEPEPSPQPASGE